MLVRKFCFRETQVSSECVLHDDANLIRVRPHLPPGKDTGTHWIGVWVGLRVGLETGVIGKNLCFYWDLQPVVRHYTE
jgi:hypothetical protein